jgi:ribosomal protein S18 acetylase RimI-like enzyme
METMMTVRRAHADDLETLLPLVGAYRRFYGQVADPAGERRFMAKHLRDASSVVFFASNEGRAAGFVQLFESWSTVRLAPVLILEDLFVDEAYRGRGIATQLINAALVFARESGAAAMFLETAMDNERAQAVYEREGWRREAEFFKYNAPL